MKLFHLDCGRKYFSLSDLKELADELSKNHYDGIELAFGNGGFRFLLDDMTVVSPYGSYTGKKVSEAVKKGNREYCDLLVNELTEDEMKEFVAYCGNNGVQVIPLFNTPGHMDALVVAMEELGFKNVRYKGSKTTIDLSSKEVVAFTKALVEKYIKWFADMSSTLFNIGCDEYANDVLTSGFASLTNPSEYNYDAFIDYVNSLTCIVKNNKMTPVMFNDGVYYNCISEGIELDKSIVVSYWTAGWPGYTPAPASFVAGKGHKILNTANEWYYVLGRRPNSKDPMFNSEDAKKGIVSVSKDQIPGNEKMNTIGEMFCVWCDEPKAEYTAEEKIIIKDLINQF